MENTTESAATQPISAGSRAGNGTSKSLIPGEADFATLFESTHQSKAFREGEIVHGTVVGLTKETVLIDVGAKSEGEVTLDEFKDPDTGLAIQLNVGDQVDVFVETVENEYGLIVLSKEKADRLKIWDEISRACEADELVEGVVVGRVKGGLSVDIGVKAFLPGSQIDIRPVRNLDAYLNERYQFKVIKFNKKRGNIVLSRRALLEKERESLKKATLANLEEGAELIGTVKNITEYGAFVDLGGIDGLLHITDMSWGRVNHPSELYKVGDEIKVQILKFNPESERVSLGVKQLSEDPWEHADRRYPGGSRVFGKVVSLTDYGAFIELEEGIDGLVHISDLSWTYRVRHPSELFKKADEVEAVVLSIDPDAERFSLGIKQLFPDPWGHIPRHYGEGRTVGGPLVRLNEVGAFVELEPGVEGLIRIEDLPKGFEMELGTEITGLVTVMDPHDRRLEMALEGAEPQPDGATPRKSAQQVVREADGEATTTLGDLFKDKLQGAAATDDDDDDDATDDDATDDDGDDGDGGDDGGDDDDDDSEE